MSAGSVGIPPIIEQHLLSLDKQLRGVAVARGMVRLMLGVSSGLAICLLLDGWLDLGAVVRSGLLLTWLGIVSLLAWRTLVRPVIQPVSYSALAALVEQQFPEIRERLTSLVELRGNENDELAPGASKLMQELMTRQTMRVFDQLPIDEITVPSVSRRGVSAAVVSALLLLAPLAVIPEGYLLLLHRFFAPWGNLAWGPSLEIKVDHGNRTIARGTDVAVRVELLRRGQSHNAGKSHHAPMWFNWKDDRGSFDSRQMDWDQKSERFVTVLPRVQHSVVFDVTTARAKSERFHIDVSDPPVIDQIKIDVEPAGYTGLAAKTLTSIPDEIRVPEFTRLRFMMQFRDPVATAAMTWPWRMTEPRVDAPADHVPENEHPITLELADDHRSGHATVTASVNGHFAVHLANEFGLQNKNAVHALTVVPDEPPEFQIDRNDQPMLCRPDEVVELPVDVADDFGLTAVELHTESSTGMIVVQSVPDEQRRDRHVMHTFSLDLSQFKLTGGQIVTYRFRAVDNRPSPFPHEVWTPARSLVTNTSLKQLPDQQLADEEKMLENELAQLRTQINRAKAELAELHQQTEKESLNKQTESDKTEQLEQQQQDQDDLIGRLERFADRLAERQMTKDLAAQPQRIADENLLLVKQRLEQAKKQIARDQLQPIAQAIDQLGAADRKLLQLEQQLNELSKLDQSLSDLKRMGHRAERLADRLEQLEKSDADPESLGQLKAEGAKLADQVNDVVKEHPELVDAARRDQLDRLNKIANDAQKLVEPQDRLAKSLPEAKKGEPLVRKSSDEGKQLEKGAEKPERSEGREIARMQEQIARDAARQALKLAQETGVDSDATKAAADFARKSEAANQQVQAGQLERAANDASAAAASADETAKQLNPERQSSTEESELAEQLAERQKTAVEKMKQFSESKDARQGAQMQGQRQLSETAKRLNEQLAKITQLLKSSLINSPTEATTSERAEKALEQARQSMDRSEQANQRDDSNEAKREAELATEKLKEVASAAQQTPANPAPFSIPKEIGTQVAEAKKHLDDAQQTLSHCDQNGSEGKQTQLAQSAEKFRAFAAFLKQNQQGKSNSTEPGQLTRGRPAGQATDSESAFDPSQMPSGAGTRVAGADSDDPMADLNRLEDELRQQARQNWGRLPGQLRTEILQGSRKKSHPEYTQRIKAYFDEITKPAR